MRIVIIFILAFIVACSNPEQPTENNRTEVGDKGLVRQDSEFESDFLYLYSEAADNIANQNYAEAESIYYELIELEENDEMAYSGLGSIYIAQNKPEEAIVYHKKALELNPESYFSNLGLGSAYYLMMQFETAINYYKIASNISPEIPDPFWGLAISYDELGNIDSAAFYAKRFLDIVPNSNHRPHMDEIINKK
ncbi:MAG: tetratricopeptide repeat protein [Crocinitomicaceae bacterium]|nr:tetratricopeptide repeat protein [Crocinitomicaceae bacterium]